MLDSHWASTLSSTLILLCIYSKVSRISVVPIYYSTTQHEGRNNANAVTRTVAKASLVYVALRNFIKKLTWMERPRQLAWKTPILAGESVFVVMPGPPLSLVARNRLIYTCHLLLMSVDVCLHLSRNRRYSFPCVCMFGFCIGWRYIFQSCILFRKKKNRRLRDIFSNSENH